MLFNKDTVGYREAEELDISLKITVDRDILSELQALYETDKESADNCYQYAIALSKSVSINSKNKSIQLLKRLINNDYYSREALYNIALVYYSLSQYEEALRYCEELYRREPDNIQVRNLHRAASYKLKHEMQREYERDAAIGVAVGAGLAAAAVGIGLLLSGRRK